MSKYIKLFETTSQYDAYTADTTNFILPNLTLCKDAPTVVYYNPTTPATHDYSQDYFTLEAIDDCTFSFDCPSGGISLSTDGGETWSEEYAETAITVSSGTKVLCKGSMQMGGGGGESSSDSSSEGGGNFLTSNGKYNIEGNIFSLYYGDDFIGQTTLVESAFNSLFSGDSYIVSAENLSLPATTLANSCYGYMFYGCTSLTEAPSLPATTLTYNCYTKMFCRCTSLTEAPSLPATTLTQHCYDGMFIGCTSLTVAPSLLATTLAVYCYSYMFSGCTSLTEAPSLPATTLAINCYEYMFKGCTSLTVAPSLPATTLTSSCYAYMFQGCTSLTVAPSLPATNLVGGCYYYMFNGCNNLNSITCYATDISAASCTNAWVTSVSANGTFTKAANMSSWTIGTNGIPNGWTVVNAS
jgi:hypothetical protein